ncbi:hypothetical protein, partial [Acinetobacter baumannii]|uniref:hypothetical protein n=1 Tax=Acinetobacter baumannii TaxID=470 RepID=UPI0013D31440
YLAFHDKLALDGIIAQTIEEALAVEVRQAERERVTAAVATNAVDLGTAASKITGIFASANGLAAELKDRTAIVEVGGKLIRFLSVPTYK